MQTSSTAVGHAIQKYPVVLAVGLASDVDLTKGRWKQCSPEELLHSFLLKLSSRISANCSDEELKAWKQVALSYPAQFEMISGEDAIYWEAWKNRQLLIQSSDTVKRTARQLCWEVHGFKEKKQVETGEVISITKLQDLYSKAKTAESNRLIFKTTLCLQPSAFTKSSWQTMRSTKLWMSWRSATPLEVA